MTSATPGTLSNSLLSPNPEWYQIGRFALDDISEYSPVVLTVATSIDTSASRANLLRPACWKRIVVHKIFDAVQTVQSLQTIQTASPERSGWIWNAVHDFEIGVSPFFPFLPHFCPATGDMMP